MNKTLLVAVIALLAAGAFAKVVDGVERFDDPSLPVTEVPNERSWKQCVSVGDLGKVCGIIYVDSRTLSVGGKLTWDGNTIFDYKFSANEVCASPKDLLKLLEVIPVLSTFTPVIEAVIKTLGKIPAKVFSLCLTMYDITWKDRNLSACAKVELTIICWLGKCVYKGNKKLGCFTI